MADTPKVKAPLKPKSLAHAPNLHKVKPKAGEKEAIKEEPVKNAPGTAPEETQKVAPEAAKEAAAPENEKKGTKAWEHPTKPTVIKPHVSTTKEGETVFVKQSIAPRPFVGKDEPKGEPGGAEEAPGKKPVAPGEEGAREVLQPKTGGTAKEGEPKGVNAAKENLACSMGV